MKNFTSYKELPDVHFGTAADLTTAFPGWVTPGLYTVDVVPTGTSPFKPLLITCFFLGYGQSKTVAAYMTATPAGAAGQPTLGVFTNDVSSTGGMARVTVRHLAVAPTVGVYADGSVAITPSFSNGQTATAVVPPSSYNVTVTAPNTPGTVLYNVGNVVVGGRHQHARLRHRRLPIDLHRGGAGDTRPPEQPQRSHTDGARHHGRASSPLGPSTSQNSRTGSIPATRRRHSLAWCSD